MFKDKIWAYFTNLYPPSSFKDRNREILNYFVKKNQNKKRLKHLQIKLNK